MIEAMRDGIITPYEEATINRMKQEMWDEADRITSQLGRFLEPAGPTRQAEAKGIARASQESVDQNNALLTTQVMHSRKLVDLSEQLHPKVDGIGAGVAQVVGVLSEIKEDTGAIRETVTETNTETKKMASALATIRDTGVRML